MNSKLSTELSERLCNPGGVGVHDRKYERGMALHIDKTLGGVRETLAWALDIIDMYDERLAQFDGKEMVYTETHIKGKEQARQVLASITP